MMICTGSTTHTPLKVFEFINRTLSVSALPCRRAAGMGTQVQVCIFSQPFTPLYTP